MISFPNHKRRSFPVLGMAHTTLGSTSGSSRDPSALFDQVGVELDFSNFFKVLCSQEPDMSQFINDMSYAGFDKNRIAKLCSKKLGGRKTVKVLLLGGMRGTNLQKILDKSVKPDPEIRELYVKKVLLSNGKGANDLTVGRVLATYPEVCMFYMMKHQVVKKIPTSPCHACLQFPAAAAIPMSSAVRAQHIGFCVEFSKLINSKFGAEYYRAAFNGQCSVDAMTPSQLVILGNVTDEESKAVDVDALLSAVDSGGGVRI